MWPQNYCDSCQKESNGDPLRGGSVEGLRASARELANHNMSPKRDEREVKRDERYKPKRSRPQPLCGRNKGDGADDKQNNQRDADANQAERAELPQAGQLTDASICRVSFHRRRSKTPNEKS